jgi:hypothetical protein
VVRFDDRLLTVLGQPAGDRHDAAVRWRQLVDLIARAGRPNGASPAVAQAIEEVRREAPNVDQDLRAAAARAVAALPLPLGLLEYFASDKLPVGAPVLAAATLDSGQWRALLEIADEETRRFIETLHPELKLDPLEASEAPEGSPGPSLHDVVERVERRRHGKSQRRSAPNGGIETPESPALFHWECGPSGEIGWVEGAPRGALIGRSIARSQESDGDRVDQEVVRAFAMRAPFRDANLVVAGEGPIAGEWKISGVPAFEPADGRFAGYRGIALREAPPARSPDILTDPDSLRELVHEIKTPLNAIIGFAEIIDGQYLGPADRRYRERAADIVTQARLLLTAIDDLDFAAKIHSSGASARPRTNLGEVVERATPALRKLAEQQSVELEASRTTRDLSAFVQPELADRLICRMFAAILERTEAGERLRLSVDQAGSHCSVSISRPEALQRRSAEELFGSAKEPGIEGFSLSLVRGLARVAGGDILTPPTNVALVFPRA